MRTLFRLLTVGALFGALAVAAASASRMAPTPLPAFSISITGVPATVARGDTVSAHVAITNLTAVQATAQCTWKLVPPRSTAALGPWNGHFSVVVAGNATAVKDVTFTVPKSAPIGTYTLTVSAIGALAPAVVTFAVA